METYRNSDTRSIYVVQVNGLMALHNCAEIPKYPTPHPHRKPNPNAAKVICEPNNSVSRDTQQQLQTDSERGQKEWVEGGRCWRTYRKAHRPICKTLYSPWFCHFVRQYPAVTRWYKSMWSQAHRIAAILAAMRVLCKVADRKRWRNVKREVSLFNILPDAGNGRRQLVPFPFPLPYDQCQFFFFLARAINKSNQCAPCGLRLGLRQAAVAFPCPLTILHCLYSNFLAGRTAALARIGLDNHMVLGELVEIGENRLATKVGTHLDSLEAKALRGIDFFVLGRQRHLIANIVAQKYAIPMIPFWSIPRYGYLRWALGLGTDRQRWTRWHLFQCCHLHHLRELGSTQLIFCRHAYVIGLCRT